MKCINQELSRDIATGSILARRESRVREKICMDPDIHKVGEEINLDGGVLGVKQ
ncbi:hypothetical protein MNBD_GAMMA05-846 [hydrothermal vent metagenome]|uniref:Uncharacterized protein n=1 Tax=hydrothermal vent metagenome TaxID=652676 RepID=A0A3B0WLA1_9ZZZZ